MTSQYHVGNDVLSAVCVIVNNDRRLTLDDIIFLLPSEIKTFCTYIFKVYLGGQRFINDDELNNAANDWPKEMDAEWYDRGIKPLFSRYQNYIDRNGDYIKK